MNQPFRIKLDENLGSRGAELFHAAGYEVATVFEEKLTSASDETVIQACRDEGRCLVTLDLDFANPFVFTPSDFCGIAVLRCPPIITRDLLEESLKTLIAGLAKSDIRGKLWIVQRRRIRVYCPNEED